MEFEVHGNVVRLVKAAAKKGRSLGSEAVKRLRRRGDVRMTTDEILALTRKP